MHEVIYCSQSAAKNETRKLRRTTEIAACTRYLLFFLLLIKT